MGGGDEVLGDAVADFGYGAGYGGEGVGIAAERDGVADGVLVAFGVERADDRLRDGLLAGFTEVVVGPDVVEAAGEVVAVLLFNRAVDGAG